MELHRNQSNNSSKATKIPYGKHIGKSVKWIFENDNQYYKWMIKEGLFEKWNLDKNFVVDESKSNKKQQKTKSKVKYPSSQEENNKNESSFFKRDNGEVWVGIKTVPIPPVKNRWIEDVKILLESIYKSKEVTPELKEKIEDILYMPIEIKNNE